MRLKIREILKPENFILFLVFIFFSSQVNASPDLTASLEAFRTYFPLFIDEQSSHGQKSALQILNTSHEESQIKIIFYHSANRSLKKIKIFRLTPLGRIDISPSEYVEFERGSISISSDQSFAAQLAAWGQIILPSAQALLNDEGSSFEAAVPEELIPRGSDFKIYVFNPHLDPAELFLNKGSPDTQPLQSFAVLGLMSISFDLIPYILEKGAVSSFKLNSSRPLVLCRVNPG